MQYYTVKVMFTRFPIKILLLSVISTATDDFASFCSSSSGGFPQQCYLHASPLPLLAAAVLQWIEILLPPCRHSVQWFERTRFVPPRETYSVPSSFLLSFFFPSLFISIHYCVVGHLSTDFSILPTWFIVFTCYYHIHSASRQIITRGTMHEARRNDRLPSRPLDFHHAPFPSCTRIAPRSH